LPVTNAIEAGVVASQLTAQPGDTVVALIRVSRGAGVAAPASFVARIGFEPTGLDYIGEASLDNVGMRVVNSEIAGDLRIAGIATAGFESGDLFGLRFVARRAGSVGALRLSIDQLNTADGTDLSKVTIRPPAADATVAQ
jgi:hypothetical protein